MSQANAVVYFCLILSFFFVCISSTAFINSFVDDDEPTNIDDREMSALIHRIVEHYRTGRMNIRKRSRLFHFNDDDNARLLPLPHRFGRLNVEI